MSTETLVRIQTDPRSGTVEAFFEKSTVVDGVTFRSAWDRVTWRLDKYPALFSQVVAVANQERADQQE